jgi:HK97 family phage prohead protease
MSNRAFSILSVKGMDESPDRVTIKGIASTPTADRMGDVVEPLGAQFKTPMPLLWQHRHDAPVGHVTFAKPTKSGIPFEAVIPVVKEAGALKDRVDEAIHSLKYGLVSAVSIGFRAIEGAIERIDSGLRFKQWEWLELSLVTVPANAEATITTIKSLDDQYRAASGQPVVETSPGVPGIKAPAPRGFSLTPFPGTNMKTIAEQIQALEAARQAKAARMTAIMQKSIEEGRSTDEAEREEFDGLQAEVATADSDLVRLRSLEALNVQRATPVSGNSVASAAVSRGPTIIIPKADPEEKFAGQFFTRKVIAKALAYMSQGERTASQIAEERWGKQYPTMVQVFKTAVPGGGTGAGEWGSELVTADSRYTGDFISYLDGLTVFDRLGLREVPSNVVIKGQDGAATANWVGESKAIPVTSLDFMSMSLSALKVAAIAVISHELLMDSSPSAEMLVRDALVRAMAQRIDETFLSADPGVPGVSPAGILYGVTPIPSAGTGADGVRSDIAALYAPFLAAKNATGLTFVANPALAKTMQLMRNALGQPEFASTGTGTLEGDRIVTGDNVDPAHLILLKPSDIYRIGDTGLRVDMSREATIEQDTAPTGATDTPVAQSVNQTNMFQEDSVAIRVIRPMNFAKRRASAVAYVNDAAYTSVGVTPL